MLGILDTIKQNNSKWKLHEFSAFLKNGEKILDYGCGDLSFAKELYRSNPTLKITGVDVVDFKKRPKKIQFISYDGDKLPFKKNEFDTAIVLYVFHHCVSAESAFEEVMRVAKRVLILESLPRNNFERPFVNFMDWFYNIIKPEPIPLTYQFKTENEWKRIFKRNKSKLKKIKEINTPSFPVIAIGKQCIMEVEKIS